VKITGNKKEGKIYYRHSGYPGGIKEENLGDVMKKDSTVVVRRAVYGMLPKNRLRDRVITRLFLFKGEAPKNLKKDNEPLDKAQDK
jgi:large subunit ribosomal protein L13